MKGGPAASAETPGRLPDFLIGFGNIMFRQRNTIFPVAFLGVLFLSRPRFPYAESPAGLALDALGFAIAACGQAVRAAVIGFASIAHGGERGKVHADELVRTGVFAHSRNPLYVGNFLIFLGLCVMLDSVAGWAIGLPAVVLTYLAIVAAEESFLREKFGREYAEYCARVSRFLPSLSGLGTTFQGLRFDGRRLVRKEYGATFAWTTAALLVLVREWTLAAPGNGTRSGAMAFAFAWIVLIVLYGVARFLKKSGRLAS